MNRPGGVIVVAIVAILGSVVTLGFGLLMGLSYTSIQANPEGFQPPPGMPAPVIDVATVVLIEAIVFAALGVFGFVSAIALILLKNWARVAFLVFAGIMLAFAIFGVVGLIGMMATMPEGRFPGIPPGTLPPGFMSAVLFMMTLFELLLAGVVSWWLVYLTRQHVRIAFLGEVAAAMPRRGPLSVTIIGWAFLIMSCFTPFVFLMNSYPLIMFGFVFHGLGARAFVAVFGLAMLVAGAGLLRWRAAAYPLAVGIIGLGAVNVLCFLLIPGSTSRFHGAVQEITAQTPGAEFVLSDAYLQFSMVAGVVFVAVPLYFLIVNRRAFLDACRATPE